MNLLHPNVSDGELAGTDGTKDVAATWISTGQSCLGKLHMCMCQDHEVQVYARGVPDVMPYGSSGSEDRK